MLNLLITPSRIYFRDLTDDLYATLKVDFDLVYSSKGYYIEDSPAILYKIILKLAYTYDLEIV